MEQVPVQKGESAVRDSLGSVGLGFDGNFWWVQDEVEERLQVFPDGCQLNYTDCSPLTEKEDSLRRGTARYLRGSRRLYQVRRAGWRGYALTRVFL